MDKRCYKLPEVSRIAAVCRSKLYEEISEGRLRAVKVGGSTRILHSDLEDWLANLPALEVRR